MSGGINWSYGEARAILFTVIGFLAIAFVWLSHQFYVNWSASGHWTLTTARVTKSYVTHECVNTNPDPEHISNSEWEKNCPRTEVPHIYYDYTVGGKDYGSSVISLQGPFFGAPGEWQAWAAARKPNQKIDIYYDPDRPEIAVIDKSWNSDVDLYKVLFCGALLVAAVVHWRIVRTRLKAKS